jgi:hypothetical protein
MKSVKSFGAKTLLLQRTFVCASEFIIFSSLNPSTEFVVIFRLMFRSILSSAKASISSTLSSITRSVATTSSSHIDGDVSQLDNAPGSGSQLEDASCFSQSETSYSDACESDTSLLPSSAPTQTAGRTGPPHFQLCDVSLVQQVNSV